MMRIFIGVEVSDDSLKKALLAWQQQVASLIGDRWHMTQSYNFHLTLRFLGQVDEDKVNQIKQNLPGWVGSMKPLNIENTFLKLLPSDEKVRVIALAFANEPSLQLVVNKINTGLNGLGFESPDLPFLPHISLARHKGKPLNIFDLQDIAWPGDKVVGLNVCAVTLFSSESSDNGVVYRPIFKQKL